MDGFGGYSIGHFKSVSLTSRNLDQCKMLRIEEDSLAGSG